jgi:hypothetical protein
VIPKEKFLHVGVKQMKLLMGADAG